MIVVTLNLRHHVDRWQERFPLVIDSLLKTRADLIGLQEVSLKLGRNNQAEIIAAELNRLSMSEQPYQVVFNEAWGGQKGKEGIAVLTRLPIVQSDAIELPIIWRVAQRVRVDTGVRLLDFYNTHLHHEPAQDESIRYPQAQALLAWMAKGLPQRVITGDFNAVPASKTVQLIKAEYLSAFEAMHGQEPSSTWPTPLVELTDDDHPAVAIDYIFCKKGEFEVQHCGLIGTNAHLEDDRLYASDHYGIMAQIDILRTE